MNLLLKRIREEDDAIVPYKEVVENTLIFRKSTVKKAANNLDW